MEPRVQSSHVEAKFSCSAACKWSEAPIEGKSIPNLNAFKSRLKTVLSSCTFDQGLVSIFKSISLYGLWLAFESYILFFYFEISLNLR